MLFLLAGLSGCESPCKPCVSGWVRPAPVYIAPEAYCSLTQQIAVLNHQFKPYEIAMDRYHFREGICRQLKRIDNDLQRVNSEILHHEVGPEKMQRQVNKIARDLAWVAERTCVQPLPDCCCRQGAKTRQTEQAEGPWITGLSKSILNRYAIPKSKVLPGLQSPESEPDRNELDLPLNQNNRNQYPAPVPTR